MKALLIIYLWISMSCTAPKQITDHYQARSLENGSIILLYDKRYQGSAERFKIADTIIVPVKSGYDKTELCPKYVILGKM